MIAWLIHMLPYLFYLAGSVCFVISSLIVLWRAL